MTKYTTTTLIEELQKYPENTPIRTELALLYHYNDLCHFFREEDESDEDFLTYCKSTASDLCIFEGSWEEDNLSDLNNLIPEYVDDWCKTNITIDKNEYDRLLDAYNKLYTTPKQLNPDNKAQNITRIEKRNNLLAKLINYLRNR